MRSYEFVMDDRLGIRLPFLQLEWFEYSGQEQSAVLYQWEQIRGRIPDRVMAFETEINTKQAQLNVEECFARSCRLNSEIAELASCINELHLWYRINQSMETKRHL